MHNNTDFPSEEVPLQTLSRDAFWQYHVTQWRESGLSKMAYCQQYSLVYHQMMYWCSKATKCENNAGAKSRSSNFVALTVAPTSEKQLGLRVRLPNGMSIEGIEEHSVSWVGKLVEQL